MLNLSQTILYYKRPEISRAIVFSAENKEVQAQYKAGGKDFHGKRPDVLKYPNDVLSLVLKGASSFHASEERWLNPLSLQSSMSEKDKKELRIGWDLVIDIDCHELEYSKIAADIIIKFLKENKVKSISCKYSGNKGFHIGVPFEAFPDNLHNQDIQELFPEAPRKIAQYIIDKIQDKLGEKILEYEDGNIPAIKEKTQLPDEKIFRYEVDKITGKRYPASVKGAEIADIDTLLISSRHLYRMPYSFNEKSGLISLPIDPQKVLEFRKEMAKPENVKVNEEFAFLEYDPMNSKDASKLLFDAYEYCGQINQKTTEKESIEKYHSDNRPKEFSVPEEAIEEEYFPPCMKIALEGIRDGKKRALFMMINFLRSVGWDKENIEKRLGEWNENNPEALRENILKGQIRYSFMKKETMLPPNCMKHYQEISICRPDKLCEKIKNPVQYATKKSRFRKRQEHKDKKQEKQKQ